MERSGAPWSDPDVMTHELELVTQWPDFPSAWSVNYYPGAIIT